MKVKITVLLLCIIFLTSCSNYNYIEETNNSNSSITNNLPIVEQEEKSLPKPAEKNNESEIIEFNPEEVLADAEPYLNEIVTENQELRKLAVQISTNCSDKECRAVEIFDYVITNYNYIDDPRGSEYIQSPFQTMEIGGGDCEDFTILINSLMENVGIETKLVLTENHAY